MRTLRCFAAVCVVLAACGADAQATAGAQAGGKHAESLASAQASLASVQAAKAAAQQSALASATAALAAAQESHAVRQQQTVSAVTAAAASAQASHAATQQAATDAFVTHQAKRAEQWSTFTSAMGDLHSSMWKGHGGKGGTGAAVGAAVVTPAATGGEMMAGGEMMDETMAVADAGEATAGGASTAECTTVAEAAAGVEDLSILVEAVTAAGDDVVGLLTDKDAVLTVFAPTNDAFVALLGELGLSKEELFSNSTLLLGVLSYHVVPGEALTAADLTNGEELETLLGPTIPLTVEKAGGDVTIEGVGSSAQVVVADVEACAAIVHIIDDVLLPVGA